MKSLIGYLKKILLLSSLSLAFLFVFEFPALAENSFTITTEFTHIITTSNITTDAVLTVNSTTTRVISYYTATIPIESLKVKCYNADTNKEYSCTNHSRTGATDVSIDLNNSVTRKDKPLKIKLEYTVANTQAQSYTIPSYIQDTTTQLLTVLYPKSNGEPLWTSDTIQNIKTVGDNFQITISNPIYHNLSILFGTQIAYKFQINKTFTNSQSDSNQTFEIIAPADSETQTIIWTQLTPVPNYTERDEDGNYILQYILSPNQTLDCSITGYIVMNETTISLTDESAFYTQKTGYWVGTQKNEWLRIINYLKNKGLNIPEGFSDVKTLDAGSQSLLIKYLDNYVVDRLSPQKPLTQGIITDSRVGFDNLVSSPNNATPVDYTDFLITILREYGVPARQVIGYVSNISGYSSDGFYNYWVEAYDQSNSQWVLLDPFLEDYSSKSLWKDKFYDHISILKRGKSPVAPKLTFYNDSDFVVTFDSEETESPSFSIESQIVFEDNNIFSKYVKTLINMTNTGNIALRNYSIQQSSFEDLNKYTDPVNNINSQVILPKQSGTIQFNIPSTTDFTSPFINIDFTNFDNDQAVLLKAEYHKAIPLYIQIIVKVLSLTIFAGLIYLIYSLINKKLKLKNGK